MMGFYGTDEEREKRAMKIADEYRAAAALFPALRKTLLKYDGKCFNKRFIDDLKAESGARVSGEKRAYGNEEWVDICTYEPRILQQLSLCRIVLKEKRMSASEAIQNASEQREKHLKDAFEIEQCLQKMPEIVQQLGEIKRMYASVAGAVPYHLRDIYGVEKYL